MPNWCINKLDVIGAVEELDKFKKASTIDDGDALSFELLVPTPESVMTDSSPTSGWRTWVEANWGTKWDISPGECAYVRHFEDELPTDVWEFSTAWAPPTNWMKRVSAMYPELVFKLWYDEPGGYFSGCDAMQNGNLLDESWESNDCFLMVECSVEQCEEYMDGPDAFTRHSKRIEADKKFFCEDHKLYEMVLEANKEDSVSSI